MLQPVPRLMMPKARLTLCCLRNWQTLLLKTDKELPEREGKRFYSQGYRQVDPQLEHARLIPGELWHLALQYTGYPAAGDEGRMQTIINWRCAALMELLVLLNASAARQLCWNRLVAEGVVFSGGQPPSTT